MTHATSDQIEEIKKGEAQAQKSIESAREKALKEEQKLEDQLKGSAEKSRSELLSKREDAVKNANNEAEKIGKARLEQAEGQKNDILSKSKGNKDAVKHIINTFMDYIKS